MFARTMFALLAGVCLCWASGCGDSGGGAKKDGKTPATKTDKKDAGGKTAAAENPWAKVKVGEWAEYKMTTAMGETKTEMTQKKTVKSKDDKEVVVTVESQMGETKMPATDMKIPLVVEGTATGTGPAPKVDKTEGDEEVEAGGKKYKCHWIETKMKVGDADQVSKIWTSPDAPLDGMVKMESSGAAKMSMVLTNSGK